MDGGGQNLFVYFASIVSWLFVAVGLVFVAENDVQNAGSQVDSLFAAAYYVFIVRVSV